MKPTNKLIYRLALVAVASSLPLFAAHGQMGGEATTGDDAHPSVDSPYLRSKPKPANTAAAPVKVSQKDQNFISHIAAGGVQAVQDAKVAESRGGASVKGVAGRIVSERSRSNQELLALAKKKGLGLGTDKIKARPWPKENFDKQWTHQLAGDYQEDAKMLSSAAASSDDKDVKAWAQRTLPMVKGQLAAIKSAGK